MLETSLDNGPTSQYSQLNRSLQENHPRIQELSNDYTLVSFVVTNYKCLVHFRSLCILIINSNINLFQTSLDNGPTSQYSLLNRSLQEDHPRIQELSNDYTPVSPSKSFHSSFLNLNGNHDTDSGIR